MVNDLGGFLSWLGDFFQFFAQMLASTLAQFVADFSLAGHKQPMNTAIFNNFIVIPFLKYV